MCLQKEPFRRLILIEQPMNYTPLLILAFCYACQPVQPPVQTVRTSPTPDTTTANIRPQDSIPCPGEMIENPTDTIPPNLYSPKVRFDFCGWYMPKDTVTPDGNYIHYLISNDSCCLDYLYLEWGNKQFRNIENLGSLRQFHPKMNPYYVMESRAYLFLEGSASGGIPIVGWSLWLFPLASGQKSEVFTTVAPDAYDLKSLTIVREVDYRRPDFPALEAFNIRTKRSKQIHLKNKISTISPTWAIDSISITPRSIFILLETLDKKGEIVLEKVFLPNDIK